MAGLPGTGKSSLATMLAERLGGVVLNKDAVRAALFPGPALDYSREQDDLTLEAIYAAARIITCTRCLPVILDGRTYSKAYQVRALFNAADPLGFAPHVVECVASDEVVKVRLERDLANGSHPAKNRTFEMFLNVKGTAEPLDVPRLVLDTSSITVEDGVERVSRYVEAMNPQAGRETASI